MKGTMLKLRRRIPRRALTVSISVLVTMALGVGYVVGDVIDVLPGILTNAAPNAQAVPKVVRTGGNIVTRVNTAVPIDQNGATALIEQFGSAPGVGRDFSIAIADSTGRIVADRAASVPREPASTLKTLTALAAASTLDMGSTLHTEVYLAQSSDASATVMLKGDGDMLLGSGQSDPNHTNGRAGLGTLAAKTAGALSRRGITAIHLQYDDTLFGDVRSPANVAVNNNGNRYSTGIASMAIDGGRQWKQGAKPANPDVFTGYPALSTTPAADAVATFSSRLRELGIRIVDSPMAAAVPAGTPLLASVDSAPLSGIMAFMLRHSDNTLAELFGRLIALKTGAENSPLGAASAVTSVVSQLGVDIKGLHMADCSGLSPGSQITAATLAEVQSYNLRQGPAAAAGEGLSVAGLNGTASERLADSRIEGLLRVKTGSLDMVTAMVGNISRINGGVLAFAVIVNDPSDYAAAGLSINSFIAKLARL